jgi:hypothetical protein
VCVATESGCFATGDAGVLIDDEGILEARGGIEPPMRVLQTLALPLGYRALKALTINIRAPGYLFPFSCRDSDSLVAELETVLTRDQLTMKKRN